MHAIGIDSHKDSLAACLVDELGTPLDERTFSNDPGGHRALFAWVTAGPEVTVGIEGSASFGAPAARSLVAAGATVREVPPQLSRRERIRTRRAGKSDPGDALAIARVTLRETDLPPVRLLDRTLELKLLVEAREDLVAEQTRVRNRLHADLRTLLPGYGAVAANLTAVRHQRMVGRLLRRRAGVQAELARARLARLRRLATEIGELTDRLTERVAGHPLGDPARCRGPGRGQAHRRDRRHRALPLDRCVCRAGRGGAHPASSGQTQHLRLNRGGNRQLNRALYMIALVQASHDGAGRDYIAKKRAEGKTGRDAIRALKRQLVRTVFRLLQEGTRSLAAAA